MTHYPTPGLVLKGTPTAAEPGRCVFRASNGQTFTVAGENVFYVDENFNYFLLGTIPAAPTPVIMKDNGLVIIVADGTSVGYAIKMTTHAFATINDPNFLGATFVDYVDTFFVLDVPGVNEWYISLALVTFENLTAGVISAPNLYAAFDPLDVAAKTGSPDAIAGLIIMHKNIWTIGTLTTEVWYNSGAADFTFATTPGVYIEHGCIAPYSIATQDLSVFWLSQDRQGKCVVMRGGADFVVKELSSKGIEAIIGEFTVVSDAIGGCYQQLGHAYYVLTFPTANRTFQVELKTGQWTELAYTGVNGLERHRAMNWAFCNNVNVVQDWQNGKLYQLDPQAFTDFGRPITRLRTIPHLLNDGKRISLTRVIADTQGGKISAMLGEPTMFLRISYDRGGTFSDALESQMGGAGEYETMPWWSNLGLARDIVLELSWSDPIDTALNGIFYDAKPAST